MTDKPSVLFVCVHNAGRSQMAAGYLTHLAGDAIDVRSAGSEPADQLNPVVVQAMAEEAIDIAAEQPKMLTDGAVRASDAEQPKMLTDGAVRASDVVITMGCGDTCPWYPGKRYEDWILDDPAGQDLDRVRAIRDQIRGRIETLIAELTPAQ
jgi:arsenate reductase (thioredoxin)